MKRQAVRSSAPGKKQFIQRLRQRPELRERFQSILELTHQAEGPLKTADQMEELLIQELRQLGHTSLSAFATQAEQRVGEELQRRDVTVRSRKKNADLVVRLWLGQRARSDLARIGFGCRAGRSSERKQTFCATSSTSANIWGRPPPVAGPPSRINGVERNKSDSSVAPLSQ